MGILLAAATNNEISYSLDKLKSTTNTSITPVITGIGMLNAAMSLQKAISIKKPTLIVFAGIAGSFNKKLQLGDVVEVVSEQYGDLGAESPNGFLDLTELGLVTKPEILTNPMPFGILPKVSAITVNSTSGLSKTALERNSKFSCDLESMEGMALFTVCIEENIPFSQIRAISNYVEERNKTSWEIEKAIKNLNIYLMEALGL